MEKRLNFGDLVESKVGRDAGKVFLVIKTDGKYAYIVNGKDREIRKPKKKNIKHLKLILIAGLNELAIKINDGIPVANERVYKAINSAKQKIQED